ncbi:MAG: ATP-binding protein, partial [Clostridia bacterium]|nr:ATP-binding protein [Clostridia bacterium]
MSDYGFVHITLSELWDDFKSKADEEFVKAVAEVCRFGISKNANRNPLVHLVKADTVTHICNMLANLKKLVDYTKITLTAEHLACLLMAACCYEIGINLTEKETEEYYGKYNSSEWKDFFKNHTKVSDYYAANKKVTDADRRLFLAQNQSKTMQTIFKEFKWNKILNRSWIYKETIFYLCGNLQLNDSVLNKITQGNLKEDDLKRCAALLRFADLMTLNANRMSEHAIRKMQKISDDYWGDKLEDYNWSIDKDGIIQVGAVCQTMQVEHELRTFLNWAGKELRQLNKAFKELPFVINSFIEPQGYTSGKFCITMEQDRILELLVGDNLYEDSYVFIRELLQNAIDAVHARVEFDKNFSEADGQVSMYSWQDEEGYTWFRIEDNGIGMTEDVVKNYFLKVGSSYYSSEHFEAEKLKYNANSNYNPISRFGIGILSCFMGDRDNTILEVSTKHFSKEKEQPVIRLDVTGLHGYYYLAKGNEVDESDFRPMHKIPESEEQKQDIGTSISIRMGMGIREELFSVREIVEKYVHFPAVNVSFQDEKGTRKFTTKQELMEKVYALNPDG